MRYRGGGVGHKVTRHLNEYFSPELDKKTAADGLQSLPADSDDEICDEMGDEIVEEDIEDISEVEDEDADAAALDPVDEYAEF